MNFNSQFKKFGNCLLKLRKKRNLSQKAASILAEMDQSYLAGLETGRRAPPRERQMARLIDALQITESEEYELREAHAISRLADLAGNNIPEKSKAMAVLVCQLRNLSISDIKLIEDLTSRLSERASVNQRKKEIFMT